MYEGLSHGLFEKQKTKIFVWFCGSFWVFLRFVFSAAEEGSEEPAVLALQEFLGRPLGLKDGSVEELQGRDRLRLGLCAVGGERLNLLLGHQVHPTCDVVGLGGLCKSCVCHHKGFGRGGAFLLEARLTGFGLQNKAHDVGLRGDQFGLKGPDLDSGRRRRDTDAPVASVEPVHDRVWHLPDDRWVLYRRGRHNKQVLLGCAIQLDPGAGNLLAGHDCLADRVCDVPATKNGIHVPQVPVHIRTPDAGHDAVVANADDVVPARAVEEPAERISHLGRVVLLELHRSALHERKQSAGRVRTGDRRERHWKERKE